jgi:hypothetical protein
VGRGEGEGSSCSGGLDDQVREIKTTLATIQAHSATIKRNLDLLKGTPVLLNKLSVKIILKSAFPQVSLRSSC